MYNQNIYGNQATMDAYGQPVQPVIMTVPMLTYEQQIAYREDMMRQQREYVQKKLEEQYPSTFAMIYGLLMIFIAIVEMALNIVSIVYDGGFAYVGHGIWGGAFLVVLAILAISLIKYRKHSLFTATLIVHMVGVAVVIMALIFVNGMGFTEYEVRYSRVTKLKTTEANTDMIPVSAVMMALGVIAGILVVVYLIMMCRVTRGGPRMARFKNGAMIYPANQQPNMFNNNQQIGVYPQPYIQQYDQSYSTNNMNLQSNQIY